MQFGYFNYPMPVNEPVLSYAPGSPEKQALKKALTDLKKKTLDIPMYIGGKAVRTGKKYLYILLMKLNMFWVIFMWELNNMLNKQLILL